MKYLLDQIRSRQVNNLESFLTTLPRSLSNFDISKRVSKPVHLNFKKRPFALETLEPRVLLSADFPLVAPFLADSVNQIDNALDELFNHDLLTKPLPGISFLEEILVEEESSTKSYAPGLSDLFVIDVSDQTNEFDSNDDEKLSIRELLSNGFLKRLDVALTGLGDSASSSDGIAAIAGLSSGLESYFSLENIIYTDTDEATSFSLDVIFKLPQTGLIDLGASAEQLGISLVSTIEVTPFISFGLEFGVKKDTSGDPQTSDSFVELTDVQAGVQGFKDLSGIDIDFGFLGANIGVGGQFDLKAIVEATVDNSGAVPSISNIAAGSDSAFKLALPVSIASGLSWANAPTNLSIQLNAAPFAQSLSTDSRLIDLDLGLSPNFDELLNFSNFGAAGFVDLLNQLTGFLNIISSDSLISDFQIPFTNVTLSKVLDLGDSLADAVLYDDDDDDDFETGTAKLLDLQNSTLSFRTLQDLGDQLNILGLLPQGEGLSYDSSLNVLSFGLKYSHELSDVTVPAVFSADLSPLASIRTDSKLTLGGSAGMEMKVGIDFTPSVELLTDRLFIDEAIIKADIGLSGAVGAEANFGFVGVNLNGQAGFSAEFQADLKGRLTITDLADSLNDLTTVVEMPTLTGSGDLVFNVSLSSTVTGFDTLLSGVGTPTIKLSASMNGVEPQIDIDTSALNSFDISKFSNFSYEYVLTALSMVGDFLGDFESFGVLNEEIPLINYSINDLLAFADAFAKSVDNAIKDPAGTLQALEGKLKSALGLSDSDAIALSLADGGILKVELGLDALFTGSLGIDLDLKDLINGIGLDSNVAELLNVANLAGRADLGTTANLDLSLDFGIDLGDPTVFYLYSSTGLVASININASNVSFRGAIGPVGLFVKEGSAKLEAEFKAGLQSLSGDKVLLESLSDGKFSATATGSLDVSLPIYLPTDSLHAGTLQISAQQDLAKSDLFNDISVTGLGDILKRFDPTQLNLLDQIPLMIEGIDLFLDGLQDAMDGEIGGISLPLIGDSLADGARFIEDFRKGFLDDLFDAVETAIDLGGDFISEQLFNLLGPSGLGILLDANADNQINKNDISLKTSDGSVPLKEQYMQWDMLLGGTVLSAGTGIDFDLGIPGLGLETQGDIELDIGWELNLGFGVSFADGAYFNIAPDPELRFDVLAHLDEVSLTGKLGFLQLSIADDAAEPSYLLASFAVDLYNRRDASDTRLGFTELGSLGLKPKIAAVADVNLDMTLSLNSDLISSAAVFPKVRTDFILDWKLGNADVIFADRTNPSLDYSFSSSSAYVELKGLGNAIGEGLKLVEFQNVSLDLGSYISDFMLPILEQVQSITEPLAPVIDF
jgi:hypothetical protein